MVNKFLYPNGGSETYIFKLCDYLKSRGHQVEYFGMAHERRCVGNSADAYTSNLDFHTGRLAKLKYPFKIIYSGEARGKIRQVLNRLHPDVVHLNNFNYQLTPSIILEIKSYEKETKHTVAIVYTAHDYQLICPNHMLYHPQTRENCEQCITGQFINCAKRKCIHNSAAKSIIGALEGYFWKAAGVYRHIDAVICPSRFLAEKLNTNTVLREKTIVLHNFIDEGAPPDCDKQDYVLYFGRFSEEKGIKTLIKACRELPSVRFVFAGLGPLEKEIPDTENVKTVGFQTGDALKKLIREARFSVYTSEWYENCPFSVMESQMYGTPVLGADTGGIPELIEVGLTGELFRSGDCESLKTQIAKLWNDTELTDRYSKNCRNIKFDTLSQYYDKLMKIYGGEQDFDEKTERDSDCDLSVQCQMHDVQSV